ncbi:hypothetical protein HN358_01605 [Candidatus Uhrbacteria bacterium]|nr:hypothetical protein [Candidatus Uhrbacteria bacterium]MBT7717733.1 hypothetical protein [Candidatus Uhrbacteria bacterium]
MSEKINAMIAWIAKNTVRVALGLFVIVGAFFVLYLNLNSWEDLSVMNKMLIALLPVVSLSHTILHAVGEMVKSDAGKTQVSDLEGLIERHEGQISSLENQLSESRNSLATKEAEIVKLKSTLRDMSGMSNTMWNDLVWFLGDSVKGRVKRMVDFGNWLNDRPESLNALADTFSLPNGRGATLQTFNLIKEDFMQGYELWDRKRSREAFELSEKLDLSRKWVRRLMHQIFNTVGFLNMEKGLSDDIRDMQDQMVLRVLEALTELIPAHRELYVENEYRSYSDDTRWCTNLNQEGVRYALAMGFGAFGNQPDAVSKILCDLKVQKSDQLMPLLEQMPDDVYRFLTKVMIDPASFTSVPETDSPAAD